MLSRFTDFIRKEHLIAEGQQVLLAVSGGRDSVALAELSSRAGLCFAIAHCNFHLRECDCDRDEQFVRRLAVHYNVPCHVAQFDTNEYAHSHGLSVEEAARELRYSFFEQVCQTNRYDLIATAHPRDDAVETFFINLLRGTGIAGLHGIKLRNGNVIRPMLCFGRADIDSFVRDNNLQYVEDYTNSQPLYLRNRIRLQLIPLLRELSPSFDNTMQDNLGRLAEVESVYRYALQQLHDDLVSTNENQVCIDIKKLKKYDFFPTILFELLRPYGFTSSVTADIARSIDGRSGLRFFSDAYCVVKDRDRLLVVDNSNNSSDYDEVFTIESSCTMLEYPLSLVFQRGIAGDWPLKMSQSEVCFDVDKLKFPLTLRHWRHGDRFRPFGMQGSRLVSDYFTDIKMDVEGKKHVWILCDANDRIIWIVNHRASAIASVTQSTKNILKISLNK